MEEEAIDESAEQAHQIPEAPQKARVGQEQIHRLLFSERISWQAIIQDLINTEQLDPWDIDLSVLSSKYLEKIRQLEEMNFFISSKVLLAASLLLRIKSEILLNEDIPSLNDILFGKKEVKRYVQDRIILDDEIPDLVPRTPLPRFRKVSLQELLSALGKAIKTETRRIKRVVTERQYEMEAQISMPKRRVNLEEETEHAYKKLKGVFSSRDSKLPFTEFAGPERESRVISFISLLHLDNQHKVWLEQEGHLNEIWILLKELYEKHNKELLEKLKAEVDAEMAKFEEEIKEHEDAVLEEDVPDRFKKRNEALQIRKSFDNPIGDETF